MNFFIAVSSLFLILFVRGESLRPNGELEKSRLNYEENEMFKKLERERRIPSGSVNTKNTVTIIIPQNNVNETEEDLQDQDNSTVSTLSPSSASPNLPDTYSTTATVFTINTNKTDNHSHESDREAPLIFPVNPDKIITDLPPDEQKNLKHENESIITDNKTSNIVRTIVEKVTEKTQSKDNESEVENLTKIPSTQLPTLQENREQLVEEKDEFDDELLQSKERKSNSLPTGIIALLSTVGCALTAVFIYVGLIFWRKYRESHYGNRELLVNDFDTGDINNFEL